MADITADGAIGPGERTMLSQLPDQGSVAGNWAQNERVLLQEMKTGNPIRDATVDALGHPANNCWPTRSMEMAASRSMGTRFGRRDAEFDATRVAMLAGAVSGGWLPRLERRSGEHERAGERGDGVPARAGGLEQSNGGRRGETGACLS